MVKLGGKGGVGTARGRSCGPASRLPGRTSGPPPPSVRPDWPVQGLQGSSEPSCFSIFKLCFRAVWRKMLALTSGAGSSRPPATPARSVVRALGESPAGLRALQTGSGRRGRLRPAVRRLLRGPRGSGASVCRPAPGAGPLGPSTLWVGSRDSAPSRPSLGVCTRTEISGDVCRPSILLCVSSAPLWLGLVGVVRM